jgi:hypothetical protein
MTVVRYKNRPAEQPAFNNLISDFFPANSVFIQRRVF